MFRGDDSGAWDKQHWPQSFPYLPHRDPSNSHLFSSLRNRLSVRKLNSLAEAQKTPTTWNHSNSRKSIFGPREGQGCIVKQNISYLLEQKLGQHFRTLDFMTSWHLGEGIRIFGILEKDGYQRSEVFVTLLISWKNANTTYRLFFYVSLLLAPNSLPLLFYHSPINLFVLHKSVVLPSHFFLNGDTK